MLKIRLQRSGRKGKANYRIVVAEHTAPIQGRYVALLGTYDPLVAKHGFKPNVDLIQEWIKKGAKPTNTVARLLKGQGVEGMEAYIVDMQSKSVKNPKEQPEPAAPAPEAAAEAKEEAPAVETKEETPAAEAQPAEAPATPAEEAPAE